MALLQVTEVIICTQIAQVNIVYFCCSKADYLLEIVCNDKSELRKHKIAYGKVTEPSGKIHHQFSWVKQLAILNIQIL